MIAVQLVLAELAIIVGGVVAVLIVGPERYQGRHRLERRLGDTEMAELEEWLEQIRSER